MISGKVTEPKSIPTSLLSQYDSEETLKRKARKLRFTHPPVQDESDQGEEAPEPASLTLSTPTPRGMTTVFAHDTGDKQLIMCVKERWGENADKMVTPGGKLDVGESPKQGASRENDEEVGVEFGNALRSSHSHEHAAVFQGTYVYFVKASSELYLTPFAPTQSPPETSRLAWFDMLDLKPRAPASSHSVEDTDGVLHTISRYALGVIEAVYKAGMFSALRNGLKRTQRPEHAEQPASSKSARTAKEGTRSASVSPARRPPSKAACTTGLAILAAVAADADGALPLLGQPPKYPNEIVLPPPPGLATSGRYSTTSASTSTVRRS